jgi:glycine/D-amino acid oxidase-like deaminating enzyme
VVEVELPDGTNVLTAEKALSDTRDPCFYARRHGRRLYMGYEEAAETSPEIMHGIARRTLEEGQKVFPALRTLTEHDIKNAWSGAIYYTLDDYPFCGAPARRARDHLCRAFGSRQLGGNEGWAACRQLCRRFNPWLKERRGQSSAATRGTAVAPV